MEVPALLPELRHLPQVGVFLPVEGGLPDVLLHLGDLELQLPVLLLQLVEPGEVVRPAPQGLRHGGGQGPEGGGGDPRQIGQGGGGGGKVAHDAQQHGDHRRQGEDHDQKSVG